MTTDINIQEFNHLFMGIWSDALKTKYKRLCSEIIENQLKQNKYAGTDLQNKYDQVMLIRKTEMVDKYWFITINPYPDIEYEVFKKHIDKVVKKKWMTKYIYVYEQRQSEENKPYHGIHFHMIVAKTCAKSDVLREIYNTCKNIVGHKESIDVKPLDTQQDLSTRLNYILGIKSTEDKQKKQQIDKIFRQQYNIQSYYIKGDWDETNPERYVK